MAGRVSRATKTVLQIAQEKLIPLEHDEQVMLFQWAALAQGQHPELRLLVAIPNGGERHKAVAAKLKAEGVKPGFPDIMLPVARCGRHGLFIELKRRNGVPSDVKPSQRSWLDALEAEGYRVVVAYGWEEARDGILFYLSGGNKEPPPPL